MEWVPVFAYLLAFAAFTALGAPIAAPFFRALPRNGAAFALPAALVPFTIVVFWVGQFTFGPHTLVVGVAVVLAGAVAAIRSGVSPEWRSVAAMYGVFAGGFLVMVTFRAASPGLTPTGGEQFLHFGVVNAIERANSLPPEDMWFAGRPLRYYYGTQLQVTSFAMLTGTPVRYGYNLGIAAFYGVLFVVAYGVGGAIVSRQGGSYRLGGVTGTFFVGLAGPTTTAIRLVAPHMPAGVADPLTRAAFGFVADRFNDGDLTRTVAELSDPFDWTWWYTRYVVRGTIQEVPLYSFVKADLHGHALGAGYVLFAAALALAYYASPASARARRVALVFGGLGTVAGLFGFTNTWSLPTAAGLAVLAVGAADPHPATLLPGAWADRFRPSIMASTDGRLARLARECWRLVLATAAGVGVLVIGLVVASPFLVFGHVPRNDGVGLFPPRSPLGPFLVIYGGLLAIFALYILVLARPALADVSRRWFVVGSLALVAFVAVTTVVIDFGVLAVLGPLIVAGWVLVRSDRGGFGLVLLIAGAGLLLSVELLYARLPLVDSPRWNTSLKVAVHGWTLGGAGAGVASAVLLTRLRERSIRPVGLAGTNSEDGIRLLLALAVVVVLLASAAFPVMVTGVEVGSRAIEGNYTSSIGGLAYVERSHANESDALRWLDSRTGHPTVVEAPGRSYQWTSPAVTVSGLPGVVGWRHEAQYRSPEAYDRRVTRVETIFTGEWPEAARALRRYNVTYVYVGPNERERYGTELRSFDREAFSVAFEGGAVTIYEVDRSNLPRTSAAFERRRSETHGTRRTSRP